MKSQPPGYQPVYNPYNNGSQPVNNALAYGQPVGYVPQSPFEPGWDEYQQRLKQQQKNGFQAPTAGKMQTRPPAQNTYSTTASTPHNPYAPPSYNSNHYTNTVLQVHTNDPISTFCPNCQAHVNTEVVSYPGPYAWGACLVCCLMGCFLCCCIPLCIEPLNKSRHFCDRCRSLLAENNGQFKL